MKKSCSSQYINDADDSLLRDMGLIHDRWVQWFSSLVNKKSRALLPNNVEELKVWPPSTLLDNLPSIFGVGETIKKMSNRTAVGPDEFPTELPKLALDGDRDGNHRIPEQFHAIVIAIWQGGGAPQAWKDAMIIMNTRRITGRSAASIEASRAWHTLARFSSR